MLGNFSLSFDVIKALDVGYIVTCRQVVVGVTYLFIFTFCLLFSRSSLVNADWTVPHTYSHSARLPTRLKSGDFYLDKPRFAVLFLFVLLVVECFFLYRAVIYWLVFCNYYIALSRDWIHSHNLISLRGLG